MIGTWVNRAINSEAARPDPHVPFDVHVGANRASTSDHRPASDHDVVADSRAFTDFYIVDKALYKTFSDRARATVAEKFDVVKQAAKLREIYLTLVAGSLRRVQRRRWWHSIRRGKRSRAL